MQAAAHRVCHEFFALALAIGAIPHTVIASASSCERLTDLKLPNGEVISARVIGAGAFLPPGMNASAPEAAAYKNVPVFCRAIAESRPSSDSRIAIEVWMPVNDWNHKFRGQGNGGYAGSLDYRGMAASVRLGYASASTDAGHRGEATDSSWARGHPEKVIDFGYRAIHEMTVKAKIIIQAFYSQEPQRAYFDSCSDGGREALMEAQRFPQDYDGILAGAPANYWTHIMAAGLEVEKTVLADQASYIPLAKLPAITDGVLVACDAQDGIKDGILNDPARCHFDPGTLACRAAENNGCLTAPQIHSLRKVYAGATDSRGQQIFPPIMPSSEAGDGGWKYWVTGESFGTAEGLKYPTGFFQNMVFEDPSWDYRTANVDTALKAADRKVAPVLNATDPDLAPFRARGGRLILYHGWIDPAIAPLNTVNYYNSVVSKMGRRATDEFVRLYMVPGMQHCAGGPGPFMFGQLGIARGRDPKHNVFSALEQWVEQRGPGPREIIATKLVDDRDPAKGVRMTRPLCLYPQIAKHSGDGDVNVASHFTCVDAEPVSAKREVLH